MVSEEEQHDRLPALFQLLRQAHHLADRFAHAVEIVVEDMARLLCPVHALCREDLLAGDLRVVRSVVLIGHGKREQRRIVLRAAVKLPEKVIDQNAVRMEQRRHRLDQLAESVLGKEALVKAEIFVDMLAVIEPLIARMLVQGIVALSGKIPDVGIRRLSERFIGAVSRERAPLRVHRAAGKNVRQQSAGHGALLQLVQRRIDLLHLLILRKRRKFGKIAERLAHDADHRDLFVLRNIGVLIRRVELFRLLLIVLLRRCGDRVLNAVDERIDAAVRDVVLHLGPRVELLVPLEPDVDAVGNVPLRIDRDTHRRAHRGACDAHPPLQPAARREQQGKRQHSHAECDREVHACRGRDVVLVHNAAGGAQKPQVGGDRRIVAQLYFEKVAAHQHQRWQRAGKHPGVNTRKNEKAQKRQHNGRQHIENDQRSVFPIKRKQRLSSDRRIRACRDPQSQNADPRAEREKHSGKI